MEEVQITVIAYVTVQTLCPILTQQQYLKLDGWMHVGQT